MGSWRTLSSSWSSFARRWLLARHSFQRTATEFDHPAAVLASVRGSHAARADVRPLVLLDQGDRCLQRARSFLHDIVDLDCGVRLLALLWRLL